MTAGECKVRRNYAYISPVIHSAYTCMHDIHARMIACMHTNIHAYMQTDMHVGGCVCVCAGALVCACMCVSVSVSVCVCTLAY